MPKLKFSDDLLLVGAFSGLLADGTMDLMEIGLMRLKIIHYPLDVMAAGMIIRHPGYLKTFSGYLVGYLAGAALSMLIGIAFVYLMKKAGHQWLILKGMVFGWIIWFLIYGGVAAGLRLTLLYDPTPSQALLQMVFHLVFGGLLAIAAIKLGNWKANGQ